MLLLISSSLAILLNGLLLLYWGFQPQPGKDTVKSFP